MRVRIKKNSKPKGMREVRGARARKNRESDKLKNLNTKMSDRVRYLNAYAKYDGNIKEL